MIVSVVTEQDNCCCCDRPPKLWAWTEVQRLVPRVGVATSWPSGLAVLHALWERKPEHATYSELASRPAGGEEPCSPCWEDNGNSGLTGRGTDTTDPGLLKYQARSQGRREYGGPVPLNPHKNLQSCNDLSSSCYVWDSRGSESLNNLPEDEQLVSS